MRKLLVLTVALAVLAGCGDDDDDGGDPSLTGRIHGAAFDPVETVFSGPTGSSSCSYELPTGGTISFANEALVLGFSAQPGVCALATDPCSGKKSFPFVWGLVASASLIGAAQPVGPGSYTVYADIFQAVPGDLTAPIRAAVFQGQRTDATCLPDDAPPSASGTIRIDVISASEVRGEIDVTFADGQGGFLRGPFTASPCAAEFDVCLPAPAECSTGAPVCQ
jgi:hypothetical protein